jgi:hypothetical protein
MVNWKRKATIRLSVAVGAPAMYFRNIWFEFRPVFRILDRLCDLVVRVLGYRSGGPGSIPGTTRKKK